MTAEAPADVLLSVEDGLDLLVAELRRCLPGVRPEAAGPDRLVCPAGSLSGGFAEATMTDFGPEVCPAAALPPLVFARQLLPGARTIPVPSIRAGVDAVFAEVVSRVPPGAPWLLHVAARYGGPAAGQNRTRLIREGVVELLQRKRRDLRRALAADAAPLTPGHTVVQLLLTAPDTALLSVARAPLPCLLRTVLSPFPRGELPVAVDKAAPCRAFAKLVEAEQRLGRRLAPGETCVDLGASPGSWSYVALQRGASVLAVDRAPLRADLMRHPRLRFVQGDAFAFAPETRVDWLLCDVIAAPERSLGLVVDWVRERRARHFVVTIKFKGADDYPRLEALKRVLPSLTDEFLLLRLCANKNEVCALGTVREAPRAAAPASA